MICDKFIKLELFSIENLTVLMPRAKIHPSKYLNPEISNNSIADFTVSSTRLT
jgi:hypothetical protein